jgi:hypothetical protein
MLPRAGLGKGSGMRGRNKAGGAIIGAITLAMTACRFSLPAPTPTPVDLLGPVFATSTSLAATAASVPTSTPVTPTATPRTGPAQACATPANAPASPALSDPNRQPQELLTFLNGGGSAQDLEGLIAGAGLAPQQGPATLSLDLDDDGWLDLAVAIQDPSQESVQPPGSLFVFACQGDHYGLVYSLGPAPEHGTPQLLAGQDLNGDRQDDLVFGLPNCGASTCFLQIQILTMANGQLDQRLRGQSDDLPYPEVDIHPGPDSGTMQIAVTGTGIGSAGAGPYRQRTRSWSWDASSNTFVVTGEALLPAVFRIHVLNDAQQAAARGDFATARQLYQQVIQDDSLKDWLDPATERANLSAFSRFRMMVVDLQGGQPDQAQSDAARLQSDFPPGSLGHAYAELGDTFGRAYQTSGDVAGACRESASFAAAHSDTILQPLYFGYANPTYTSADICPGL